MTVHLPAHQGTAVARLEIPAALADRLERAQKFDALAYRAAGPDFLVAELAGADQLAIPAIGSALGAAIVAIGQFGIRFVQQPRIPVWPGFQVDDGIESGFQRRVDFAAALDMKAALETGKVKQRRCQQENDDGCYDPDRSASAVASAGRDR